MLLDLILGFIFAIRATMIENSASINEYKNAKITAPTRYQVAHSTSR
jgi:hypothetical protein